jgi:hypothetical protein
MNRINALTLSKPVTSKPKQANKFKGTAVGERALYFKYIFVVPYVSR